MTKQFQLPLWTDKELEEIWRKASDQVILARANGYGSALNENLLNSAERYAESPLGALLISWAADSLLAEEKSKEALDLYEYASKYYSDVTFGGVPVLHAVLSQRAIAQQDLDQHNAALEVLSELAERSEIERPRALYRIGQILESTGRPDEARRIYLEIADIESDYYDSGFTAMELGRRAGKRIELQSPSLAPTLKAAQRRLVRALRENDKQALLALASPTHFLTGPAGGCAHFAGNLEEIVDRLSSSIRSRKPSIDIGTPLGEGEKRYLRTDGWRGEWLSGRVDFLIANSAQGWEWSGLVLHEPSPRWLKQWNNNEPMTNQPAKISLAAPWPANNCFMAGGLSRFRRRAARVALVPAFFRAFLATFYASRPCGFGTRGFYYNQGSTHQGMEAFAIDFTRYLRGVAFAPRNRGTPVLCTHLGVVRSVVSHLPNGALADANLVHVQHEYQDAMRYESRYLHLEGPRRIPVSPNMYIRRGRLLGTIDDTGNSFLHHLHFVVRSIDNHWRSARPTPMANQALTDHDDGKCVCSDTEEPVGWHLYEEDPPPIVEP